MPGDWSRPEVEAVVADYFAMFESELVRRTYRKTEHRRALALLLNDRSEGSIEFKHQNISAVLLDYGFPYIPGYKPRSNYQQLLADVVAERVLRDRKIEREVQDAVESEPPATVPRNPLELLVDAPKPSQPFVAREDSVPARPRVRSRVDYLERESRNASLGLAGEQLVIAFERARLERAGAAPLASRIEHLALHDDSAGFDILSYEVDGAERLIEVKTTGWGKLTPFFVSANELSVSRARDDCYHLYRVFDYRSTARLFTVPGALDESFDLDPSQFIARIA